VTSTSATSSRAPNSAAYACPRIDDTLKTLNLESERVRDLEVAITDIERVPEMINKYAAELVAVGPAVQRLLVMHRHF